MRPFTRESTLGELLADPVAAQTIATVLSSASPFGHGRFRTRHESAADAGVRTDRAALAGFSAGKVTVEQLDELLAGINAQRP